MAYRTFSLEAPLKALVEAPEHRAFKCACKSNRLIPFRHKNQMIRFYFMPTCGLDLGILAENMKGIFH